MVFSSVLVGLIAGLAISVVHHFTTEPLILHAETFESAGPEAGHSHDAPAPAAGDATATAAPAAADHHHDDEAWAPADGFERSFYTVGANVLTAIGFALVLNGLFYAVGQPVDWRGGLLWGLGAFVAVMLAPGLGLHPELPGTPAAELAARQTWWIGTALATAVGLGLLIFQRKPWAAALAVVLILAPHVIGAPQPPAGEHALAPEELSHRFVVLALVTSFLFWAMIGTLSGYFHRRFEG